MATRGIADVAEMLYHLSPTCESFQCHLDQRLKHLRVLPILKVYLLKLALKKEQEMLQEILELEAI